MTLLDENFVLLSQTLIRSGFADATPERVRNFHTTWSEGSMVDEPMALTLVLWFQSFPTVFGGIA